MLKTKVILSRVSNLSDARYASGMGVDYIGFNINANSDHFVTSEQVKMITDWLSGVKIIGNIEDEDITSKEAYVTDYIQTSNEGLIEKLDNSILTLDFNINNQNELGQIISQNKDEVAFFILNVAEADLLSYREKLSTLCSKYNIYISTNYTEENINLVIGEVKPTGIVIYGSTEEQPGLSSYDGIADILEQLEIG